MNEYEKSLCHKSNNELGEVELNRIRSLVAHVKRGIEIFSLVPQSAEEYASNPKAFIEKYGLKLTEYDIDYCMTSKYDKEKLVAIESKDYMDLVPESFYRYRQFLSNKIFVRDKMRDEYCAPTDEKVKVWRQRQIDRCNGDIGGANLSFIHAICCFEMASGCSVGCDFCGLGAKGLQKLFRYTEENAALYRNVLNILKDRFGIAAGMGMMYLATEPLDNPDYELFEKDYRDIFKYTPQITTAVPDRNIERTRQLVTDLEKKGGFIHRFTVRSLDTALKLFEAFTPEELINVEMIPQYEDAPGFTPYTVVGNESYKEGRTISALPEDFDENGTYTIDAGTICCIDGFCVNFCDKTIKLFTPCHMTSDYPEGIAIADKVEFTDADDFKKKLDYLIDKYMVNEVPKEEPLRLYSYFHRRTIKGEDALVSLHGGEALLLKKLPKDVGVPVIECLIEGNKNKHEIVKEVVEKTGASAERVFWMINQLWKMGFIVDPLFFR